MRRPAGAVAESALFMALLVHSAVAWAAPSAPSGVAFSNASLFALTLSWSAASGADPATGFDVTVSSDPGFDAPVPGFNNRNVGGAATALVSGLYPGTTYYARVQAYDISGSSSAFSASASGVTSGTNVPGEFEITWSSLTASVQEFQNDIGALWSGSKQATPPDYGVELELADCNRGPSLLTNQTRSQVLAEIQALHQIGVTTVQTCVGFPLPYQPYFDWAAQTLSLDTATVNAQNFLNFYVWISTTVHSMNMKFSVETPALLQSGAQVNQLLPGLTTYFTQVIGSGGCNAGDLNYETARASAAVTVADLVRPDYLELQTEPTTEGMYTGCADFSNPNKSADFNMVSLIVSSLTIADAVHPFGLHTAVKTTAGIGDWNWPAFNTTLFTPEAQLPGLDFLDMHIYPINNDDTVGADYISNIMAMVALAKQYGKTLSLTETWPHTNNDSDLPGTNGQAPTSVISRDLYCFWAPFYQYFFTTLSQLENYAPIAMSIAFNDFAQFNCADYYAYNSPTPCSQLSGTAQSTCYSNVINGAETGAVANMTSSPPVFSQTGQAYARIIANNGLPAPTISALSPSSVSAGSGPLVLMVTGGGFGNGSVIKWNGTALSTVYGGPTQLFAVIPASDLSGASAASVAVFTLGGGTSGSSTLTIGAAAPTLTSVSPSAVTAGGAAFTLTVNGSNFLNGATVMWNGTARTTTYVSANDLQADILAADIASAGTAEVTVANPGGVAASQTLTVSIASPLSDLSAVRAYPNPWRSDAHDGLPVTFDRLPQGSTIKIFDLAGRWVRTLAGGSIIQTWDLTNDGGKKVASGLYFYVVTDPQGDQSRGKLTVVK